jgi:Zn-finger nucleic acid-binding protein
MAQERVCPKCADYVALTSKVIEDAGTRLVIDVCRQCHGVWLDWDELGPAKALSALLQRPMVSSSPNRDEQLGVCPSCDPAHGLARILVGAYAVDRCPECEGLWFDGGELGPMLTDRGFEALLKALRANP